MQTMHHGGVFTTRALDRQSDDALGLLGMNTHVIESLGLVYGVTHTEFIKAHANGRFYFLETAARVGGAHIADVVEHASGINPWVEWARMEASAIFHMEYALPTLKPRYAGSIISLARQQQPDTSSYNAPEVVQRLNKHHHAGLILCADSAERIETLVNEYTTRFLEDFCAVEPPPDKATA
jgi:biotin carboxylase